MRFGDNTTVEATGIGDIWVASHIGNKQYKIRFCNTLHIPTFRIALISISKLVDAGHTSLFDKCGGQVMNHKNVIMKAIRKRGLHHLQVNTLEHTPSAHLTMDINVLHRCMGHIGMHRLQRMVAKNQIGDVDKLTRTPEFCEPCVMGKMKKLLFKRSKTIACSPLDIVHSDVGGPVTPALPDSHKY